MTVDDLDLAARTGSLRRRPPGRPSDRAVLGLILVGAGLWSALAVGGPELNSRGWEALGDLGVAAVTPEVSPDWLTTLAGDALTTVSYAVVAMVVATVVGFAGGLVAAGAVGRRSRPATRLARIGARSALGAVRAVHELVWALLFVQAFGLEPWAAVLAIGLPYGGMVGRVVAERLEDVPAGPLASLTTAGASELQVTLYGRLPLAGADLVGYLVYRFECAVRASAVLGFVGLGGLGFRIENALVDLDFRAAWSGVYVLVAVVAAVNLVGGRLRRGLAW